MNKLDLHKELNIPYFYEGKKVHIVDDESRTNKAALAAKATGVVFVEIEKVILAYPFIVSVTHYMGTIDDKGNVAKWCDNTYSIIKKWAYRKNTKWTKKKK